MASRSCFLTPVTGRWQVPWKTTLRRSPSTNYGTVIWLETDRAARGGP
jgi:hypothetical protein